jgi:hypothetical protein
MNLAFLFSLPTRAACLGSNSKIAEMSAFILLEPHPKVLARSEKNFRERTNFKLRPPVRTFSGRYDLCYGEGDGLSRARRLRSFDGVWLKPAMEKIAIKQFFRIFLVLLAASSLQKSLWADFVASHQACSSDCEAITATTIHELTASDRRLPLKESKNFVAETY